MEKFDLIIENCVCCGKQDMRKTTDGVLEGGEIFQFDLCVGCEDKAGRMLNNREAHMTLFRLVDYNEKSVYGFR